MSRRPFNPRAPNNELPKLPPGADLERRAILKGCVQAGIAKRQTASTYLARLADAGVLVETPIGREKLFVHRALLELLASESHVAPPYGAPKTR